MRWRDNRNGCIIAVSSHQAEIHFSKSGSGKMGSVSLAHDTVPAGILA